MTLQLPVDLLSSMAYPCIGLRLAATVAANRKAAILPTSQTRLFHLCQHPIAKVGIGIRQAKQLPVLLAGQPR